MVGRSPSDCALGRIWQLLLLLGETEEHIILCLNLKLALHPKPRRREVRVQKKSVRMAQFVGGYQWLAIEHECNWDPRKFTPDGVKSEQMVNEPATRHNAYSALREEQIQLTLKPEIESVEYCATRRRVKR